MKFSFLRIPFPLLLVAFGLAGPWIGTASAQSMSTLQNLPAVGLSVRILGSDADEFGLTDSSLQGTVSRGLAEAGIRVLDADAANAAPGAPTLHVIVYLSRMRDRSAVYTIHLSLKELVQLERPTETIVTLPASTWERVSHGVASSSTRVQVAARRLLDLFVQEHGRENR